MESFEKAHVSRNKTFKKGQKPQKRYRKQLLKTMLQGYRRNDNNIIKNALKIAPSDIEDDVSFDLPSDSEIPSLITINDMESKYYSGDSIKSTSFSYDFSGSDELMEPKKSNSRGRLEDSSLSPIASKRTNVCSPDTMMSSNMSFASSELNSLDDNQSSLEFELEQFDEDGSLADRILLNLEKAKKEKSTMHFDNSNNNQSRSNTSSKLHGCNVKQSTISSKDIEKSVDEVDSFGIELSNSNQPCSSVLDVNSLLEEPFPLISEGPNAVVQSYSKILEDYKHSTAVNTPTANYNLTLDTNIFFNPTTIKFDGKVEMQSVSSGGCIKSDSDTENDEFSKSLDGYPSENDDVEEKNITSINLDRNLNLNSNSPIENLRLDNTVANETISDIDLQGMNSINVYYIKNSCIFVLRHPANLYIKGKVRASALAGKIEIFGYTLTEKTVDVYAPHISLTHMFQTIEADNNNYGLFRKLTRIGITVAEAEEIVVGLNKSDGVLHLENLRNISMDFVENFYSNSTLFSPMRCDFQKAADILGCSLYSDCSRHRYENLPICRDLFSMKHEKLNRGIICGGKNSGKSTFLRYYVNKRIQNGPILFVDLDPGQCEFTVAGCLSATIVKDPLIGPNFTHLQTPERSLNIASIDVMRDVNIYVKAIKDLIDYCSIELKHLPWIVNTMGMCNGLGIELIMLTILKINPTFLIQIISTNAKNSFSTNFDSETVSKRYEGYPGKTKHGHIFQNVEFPDFMNYAFLSTQSSVSARGKPSKDMRYLNFLAYFGELMFKNTSLLAVTPYEVDVKNICIGTNFQLKEEDLYKVLNAKIVCLCKKSNIVPKLFDLGNQPLFSYGHGLIRSVDPNRGLLYVITNVPHDKLAAVNTLVYANWTPELGGQEMGLQTGTIVPYRAPALPHLMRTPRRRFNPMPFLKMSRMS